MPFRRTRRTTTRRTRARPQTSRRRGAYALKRRQLPARYQRASPRTYRKTKKMATTLSAIGENKLIGKTKAYPNRYAIGDSMGYTVIPMGRQVFPTAGLTPEVPLSVFNFPQGDEKNERTGRSVYLKGCSVRTRIVYQPHYADWSEGGNAKLFVPQFCRYMVVRPKNNAIYTSEPNPDKDLFLDVNGDQRGITSTFNDFTLTNSKINSRRYAVMVDKKFTLGPSSVTSMDDTTITAGQTKNSTRQFSSKYPSFKDVNFNIPIGRKVRYQGATDNPESLNDDYWVILVNTPIGSSIASGSAETMMAGLIGINWLSQTKALDM